MIVDNISELARGIILLRGESPNGRDSFFCFRSF